MKKLTILALLSFFLTSCSIFQLHKNDIIQGNVITNEDVSQLRRGMSEDQVIAIMGNPVVVNVFEYNRLEYVYTIKRPADSKMSVDRLSCVFSGGRLVEMNRSQR